MKSFTQPIQQIAQVINQVQSMAAASERVFEFLNEGRKKTSPCRILVIFQGDRRGIV